jgi:hypothetical protein
MPKYDLPDRYFPVANFIARKAVKYGLPILAPLTLCIAESDLKPEALNAKDEPYGSSGLSQVNLQYAPEIKEWGWQEPLDDEQINILRVWYADPENSLAYTLPALKAYLERANGDIVDACVYWNWPAAENPKISKVRWLYEMSFDKAQQLVGDPRFSDPTTFQVQEEEADDPVVIERLHAQVSLAQQEMYVVVGALRKEIETLRGLELPQAALDSVGAIEAAANTLEQDAAGLESSQ